MTILQLDSEQLRNLIQSSVRQVLNEISSQTKTHFEQSEELLTVSEAAELLALSVPTIYSKVSKGELPSCKAPGSKRLYFSKTDLVNYIKAGRKKTNAEIEAEAEEYLGHLY